MTGDDDKRTLLRIDAEDAQTNRNQSEDEKRTLMRINPSGADAPSYTGDDSTTLDQKRTMMFGRGGGGDDDKDTAHFVGIDAQLREKLALMDAYGTTRLLPQIELCRRRYFSWAGSAPQLNRKALNVNGVGEPIEDADHALAQLQAALGKGPALDDLDGALKKLSKVAAQALPSLTEAAVYYGEGHFEKDDLSKGERLHLPLLVALTGFEKARDEFSAAVFFHRRPLLERDLAEQPDSTLLSYALRLVLSAETLLGLMQPSTAEIDSVDARAALDGFLALVSEAERALASHDADDEDDDDDMDDDEDDEGVLPLSSAHLESAQEFAGAASERLELATRGGGLAEAEQAMVDGGLGWMADGSWEKMEHHFLSLLHEHSLATLGH